MKTLQKLKYFRDNPKLVESDLIYDGGIIQVYKNKVTIKGINTLRDVVHHLPAAAILPITNDNKVILVRQNRSAVNEDLYEIPAGLRDIIDNQIEEPLITAQRELEEETGYQAKNWESIGDYFVSPGFTDELISIFIAKNLIEIEEPLVADDDEEIEIYSFDRDEICDLIKEGQIKDMKTRLALQFWLGGN